MLKHKMKQWLSDHQPETLRVCSKAEPSSPTSTTPPLPLGFPGTANGTLDNSETKKLTAEAPRAAAARSPCPNSAVNQYPSLKSKILGPKMGAPVPPFSNNATTMKENSVNGASLLGGKPSFSSTTNLAAAAALATGLHSKRKRDGDSPVKPSPIRIVRSKEDYDYDYGKPAMTTTNAAAAALQSPSKSSNKPPTSIKPEENSEEATKVLALAAALEESEEEEAAVKEETDDDIARRLHQELNCAPMRQSRSRRNISCTEAAMAAEDAVHGQDPGILPSC